MDGGQIYRSKRTTDIMIPSILLTMLVTQCRGNQNGAPMFSCTSMIPQPGQSTQRSSASSAPYEISAKVEGGDALVTLSARKNTDKFKGFLLQALTADTRDPIPNGAYEHNGSPHVKSISCPGNVSGLTHADNSWKNDIRIRWTPPYQYWGAVVFRGTIVKDYGDTFWTTVESGAIYVASQVPGRSDLRNRRGAAAGRNPKAVVQSLQTSQIPEEEYSQCRKTINCEGGPGDCVNSKSCNVLVSYIATAEGKVAFRIITPVVSDGYASVGISDDLNMGKDFVTDCIYKGTPGQPFIEQSWNTGKLNVPTKQTGISSLVSEYEDGKLICEWDQSEQFVARGVMWNLRHARYALLVAKGSVRGDGRKVQHTSKYTTRGALNLTAKNWSGPIKPKKGHEEKELSGSNAIQSETLVTLGVGLTACVATSRMRGFL